MTNYRRARLNTLAFLIFPLSFACGSPDNGMDPNNPMSGNPDTTAPTFAGAQSAVAGDPTSAPGSITVSWKAASDDHSTAQNITYLVYQATTQNGESFTAPT